jgi:hypothetical protein
MSASESSYPVIAKHVVLTTALVAAAALKAGKDVGWYASRKLNDPCKGSGSRPASAR